MAQQQFDSQWYPIIKELIGNSPPCQLSDVVTSCRRLFPASQLPEDLVEESCAAHNERTGLIVTLPPADDRAVVCALGRYKSEDGDGDGETTYREPGPRGLIFSVDQGHQTCTEAKPAPTDSTRKGQPAFIEHFREAVDTQLGSYVNEYFPPRDGLAAKVVYATPSKHAKGIALHIVIASRRSRRRGHWAGIWRSEWTVDFVPGDPVARLEGDIEFIMHYSEAGNMHLRRKAHRHAEVDDTDNQDRFACGLVEAIAELEEGFHISMHSACVTFGATKLKAMRRTLPVSKERFDWRPVRHALARDMRGGIEMTKQSIEEETVDF